MTTTAKLVAMQKCLKAFKEEVDEQLGTLADDDIIRYVMQLELGVRNADHLRQAPDNAVRLAATLAMVQAMEYYTARATARIAQDN